MRPPADERLWAVSNWWFDRASLEIATTARIGNEVVSVGYLELQIADKRYLGARTAIEDAVHRYPFCPTQ